MATAFDAAQVAAQAGGPFSGPVGFRDVERWAESVDLGETVGEMRPAFERLLRGDAAGSPSTLGRSVEIGIDGLLFGSSPDPWTDAEAVVVWLGGGGYVLGSPESHERLLAYVATATDLPTFAPRYRSAPEYIWPAQLADALAAARAVQDAGCRLVLGGISAGGHQALNTALHLARDGRPADALVLLSPNTDRSGKSQTRQLNTPRDPMIDDEGDRAFAEMAMSHLPDDNPEKSPLLADLSMLPPTHIEVGGREVLLDDSRLLAEYATRAGADVSLHIDENAFHLWQLFTPWLPAANHSLDRVAAFISERLVLRGEM